MMRFEDLTQEEIRIGDEVDTEIFRIIDSIDRDEFKKWNKLFHGTLSDKYYILISEDKLDLFSKVRLLYDEAISKEDIANKKHFINRIDHVDLIPTDAVNVLKLLVDYSTIAKEDMEKRNEESM